jgi:hypothetical protein
MPNLMNIIRIDSRAIQHKKVGSSVVMSPQDVNGCLLYLPLEQKIMSLSLDHSGNEHHGILHGTTTIDNGKINKAANFDGIDDLIDCGGYNILDTFTAMAWVKPLNDAMDSELCIIGSRGPEENSFDFKLNPGLIHGDIGIGTDWITTNADVPFDWVVGEWLHVCYVVTPLYYKIYVNGQLLDTVLYSDLGYEGPQSVVCSDANHILTVGNANYDGSLIEFFHGVIDEVFVYGRERSDTEIFNYYERTK